MGETRNRNSVRVNEEGKKKLLKAKAQKNNYDDSPLTFLEIATKAGVSEKTVKRFFAEEFVSRSHAEWIAKALDLELTYLIDAKATTPPPEILATLINWREVCSTMLEPHRRISSNFLMQDESAKKDKEQIYVPLALVQRTKTDKRDKGNFSPDVGTRLYEPQYETQQRFEHKAFLSQILEGGEGKTKGQQIAVIGEPGAGKTTLLQTIAFWVLEKNLGLPVWISLADLGRNGILTDIQTYICNSWLEQAIPATQLTQEVREDFTNQIQQRRVWLLLDGVDEMSEASHQPLEEISRQLNEWLRSSRVVLTCRLNVWQADVNALETFETYRLLDFDYPQQVHQFIDNWFENLSEKGERLKTALDSAERLRLRDLVQTPLRLALLCGIWQTEEGNLPETKAGLYHQCVQQFYRWKQNRFRTSKKEQYDLNQVLGRLALRDINEGSSRFRLLESFISEELGYPDDQTSLFYKALQLGWLNDVGIAAESSSKEKVYAFYHATFEEYFAALAVDDWHYFLKHVPENPEQGTYRIFEPQWKEVILLWFGREDVKEQQKKDFIKALVEFEDGCNSQSQIPDWKGFYEYRAYFIAAAGIAEFKDCDLADAIVKQIVRWGFGYFNIEKQKWQTFDKRIEEEAKAVLAETDREKAISTLEELIHNSQDEKTRLQAASSLGQIAKDNPNAITALIELIHNSQVTYVPGLAAQNLEKIGKDNPIAITALVELIHNYHNKFTSYIAISTLGKIAKDNLTAITALIELIHGSQTEEIRKEAAKSLGLIDHNNAKAIAVLIELISTSQSEINSLYIADSLLRIDTNNPTAIDVLVEIIHTSKYDLFKNYAAEILGATSKVNLSVITALVDLMCTSLDQLTRRQAVESLGLICKNKPNIIAVLIQLINIFHDKDIYICGQASVSLWQFDKDNPLIIATLVDLMCRSNDEKFRRYLAENLGEIANNNPTAIAALVELMLTSQDEFTRWQGAESLGKIDKNTSTAFAVLVELICQSDDEDMRDIAVDSLMKILTETEKMYQLTIDLKKYLSKETYKNDLERFKDYYQIIWHSAQNMTYPTFYQAWHGDSFSLIN
ncbi:MAG: HEAT repeat domain-containing protein [Nostoc sp.]|uniref:HEAT repeat domain-containing protein n=1 Tax=Nostoc sp. TaxID=1180 RepID=UPI002FF3C680